MSDASDARERPSPSQVRSTRDELGVGRLGFEEWLTTALWERVALIELDYGLIAADVTMTWMTGPHTAGLAHRAETLTALEKLTATFERGFVTEDEFREERRITLANFMDQIPRAAIQASLRAAVPDVLTHVYPLAARLVYALASPHARGRDVSVVVISDCPHPLAAMLGEVLGAWHSYGNRDMGWSYSPIFSGWLGPQQQPALKPKVTTIASAVLDSGRELSLVVGASSAARAAAAKARAFLTTLDVTEPYGDPPKAPVLHYDATTEPQTVLDWINEQVPLPAAPSESDLDPEGSGYEGWLRRRRDHYLDRSADLAQQAARTDQVLANISGRDPD